MTGSTDDARQFYDAEIRAAMAGRGRGLASRRSNGSGLWARTPRCLAAAPGPRRRHRSWAPVL